MAWFTYIVSCADDTLYTGITTDLERRVGEHNSGNQRARYTRNRRPGELVYSETFPNRSMAAKREAAIKRMGADGKRGLLSGFLPAEQKEGLGYME